MIETYLGIEKRRFSDRLDVRIHLSSDAGDCLVPPLILQPLVENAVKHGIAPAMAGGVVELSAYRVGDAVELVVCDTGNGFASDAGAEGRGLEITRRRLQAMYGDRAAVTIANGTPQGCEVRVRLPAMTESAPAGDASRV